MNTVITVTVQKYGKEGDLRVPVTLLTDQHRFDTDAQAEVYYNELMNWINERPVPDIDISPFPRARKQFDENELDAILEDMLTPETIHAGVEPFNPHGYNEVGDY